jgi:hypothetical protein
MTSAFLCGSEVANQSYEAWRSKCSLETGASLLIEGSEPTVLIRGAGFVVADVSDNLNEFVPMPRRLSKGRVQQSFDETLAPVLGFCRDILYTPIRPNIREETRPDRRDSLLRSCDVCVSPSEIALNIGHCLSDYRPTAGFQVIAREGRRRVAIYIRNQEIFEVAERSRFSDSEPT